ncbi:uncharacterized protein BX664DRAFT_360230 [Halteromyces radiatus]|uniref:uncharacterized protein n=1 Tax=Halteromyces radiatus TaxID=101107 RepID=UPI00221F91A6|nr:uncharacterized protein BX664DRAFT_360230 [Halteromyces radiatus]KAI8086727.1 hypothetical protein BX664DRAFT_360230 [Halteromyces radiatus]
MTISVKLLSLHVSLTISLPDCDINVCRESIRDYFPDNASLIVEEVTITTITTTTTKKPDGSKSKSTKKETTWATHAKLSK